MNRKNIFRNAFRKLTGETIPFKAYKIKRSFWEERFKEGKWNFIREIEEFARYSIILGYIQFLQGTESILDVGCGEGILCERLCEEMYTRYVGIDFSSVAIDRVSVQKNDKNRFYVAKIEEFITHEKFDIIIFNECLYYFEDPISILQRYEDFLSENGMFIVSMHQIDNHQKLWEKIDKNYFINDSVSVTNKKGVCWTIKVLDNKG